MIALARMMGNPDLALRLAAELERMEILFLRAYPGLF